MAQSIVTTPNPPPDTTEMGWSTTAIASHQLAERKEQVVQLDAGASLKLVWFEFIDREAKSVYYSELLRREAHGRDS